MRCLFACGAASLAGGNGALAQSAGEMPAKPPAELADFRETFDKAVALRSLPARETFAASLQKLAQERAEHGDYEGAIRARDRRTQLLSTGGEAAAEPGADGEIVVDMPTGNRSGGGLKFDAIAKKFVGFDKNNQTIRWDLNKTTPGLYSVIVTYSCGDPVTNTVTNTTTETGGSFTLQEETSLSTTSSPPLRRTVLPTGGWNKTFTRNIGKVTVTGTRATLLLSVEKANPGGLMHLFGIRLVPARSDAPDGGDPLDDSPAELARLRAMFRSAILPKTTPLTAAYGTRLKAMREALTNANDLEGAYEVQKEFIAAGKLSKDPTLLINDPTGN